MAKEGPPPNRGSGGLTDSAGAGGDSRGYLDFFVFGFSFAAFMVSMPT